jgi:hypothetical protein
MHYQGDNVRRQATRPQPGSNSIDTTDARSDSMNFFNGLYNFEIVLLILGVLLFLIALVKFMKNPSPVLVAFFLISIAMIGYPSVQSIAYQNGVVTINKQVHDLEADPTNEALRSSLQQNVALVEQRPTTDPVINVALATAHFALGNEAQAKTTLQQALRKNPALPAAKDLNNKIALSDRVQALTAHVEAAPADTAAKTELEQTVSQISKVRTANPTTLRAVTRAQALSRRH